MVFIDGDGSIPAGQLVDDAVGDVFIVIPIRDSETCGSAVGIDHRSPHGDPVAPRFGLNLEGRALRVLFSNGWKLRDHRHHVSIERVQNTKDRTEASSGNGDHTGTTCIKTTKPPTGIRVPRTMMRNQSEGTLDL